MVVWWPKLVASKVNNNKIILCWTETNNFVIVCRCAFGLDENLSIIYGTIDGLFGVEVKEKTGQLIKMLYLIGTQD
jgi:hypothetical protein